MREKERSVVSSDLGSIALVLLLIGAFHLLGPTPLWVPTKFGSEEFNPLYLRWIFASVPAGSLLGCIAGTRKNEHFLAWWDYLISWFAGCFVGGVALFQSGFFFGVLNPLLVCGVGLTLVCFVFWLLSRRTKTLAEQIRSFRAN